MPVVRGGWDFCRNGPYTERGIKALHGYGSERWRIEPEFAVKLDPALGLLGVLMEPTTIVAKAWEQIDRVIARATIGPERVLVTGAGPIGLLAALLAQQRGYEVHVLDLATDGPKPDLVRDLGATYHPTQVTDVDPPPDIIVEATGASSVVLDAMCTPARTGSSASRGSPRAAATSRSTPAMLNRTIVLENDVVFGTVNANRRHYEAAAEALVRADRGWLERLITRRVPLDRWREALTRESTTSRSSSSSPEPSGVRRPTVRVELALDLVDQLQVQVREPERKPWTAGGTYVGAGARRGGCALLEPLEHVGDVIAQRGHARAGDVLADGSAISSRSSGSDFNGVSVTGVLAYSRSASTPCR